MLSFPGACASIVGDALRAHAAACPKKKKKQQQSNVFVFFSFPFFSLMIGTAYPFEEKQGKQIIV